MGFLDSYLSWILEASLRASFLGGGILVLQFLLTQVFRLPSQWKYTLWIPFLGVLCSPFLPRSPLSFETWITSIQIERVVQHSTDLFYSHYLPPLTPPQTPDPSVSSLPTEPAKSPRLNLKQPSNDLLSLPRLVGLLLLGGGIANLALAAAHYQYSLRQIRKKSSPVEIELLDLMGEITRECGLKRVPLTLLSDSVRSPAVTGFLWPVILLPTQFLKEHSAQEARFVLLHECTHIRRHDLLANWALTLLQALHWFNPLLHYFFRRIRSDRELACDDAVIRHLSEEHRTEYGLALLRFERCLEPKTPNRGLIGIFERASGIRARISAIANYQKPSPLWHFAGWAVLLLLCLTGATKSSSSHTPDFWFEFWSVQDSNADQYLQQSVGVRKYREWQSDPVSYWGTSANSLESQLTYRFPFAAPALSIQMRAKLASFNFNNGGGRGVGECSLWASKDGTQWIPLLNNPTPQAMDSYRDFEEFLPGSLCGSTEIWIQIRFRSEGALNARYTTAQFSRSTPSAGSPAFWIAAWYAH